MDDARYGRRVIQVLQTGPRLGRDCEVRSRVAIQSGTRGASDARRSDRSHALSRCSSVWSSADTTAVVRARSFALAKTAFVGGLHDVGSSRSTTGCGCVILPCLSEGAATRRSTGSMPECRTARGGSVVESLASYPIGRVGAWLRSQALDRRASYAPDKSMTKRGRMRACNGYGTPLSFCVLARCAASLG